MTDVARVSSASMDASTGMFAPQITGSFIAGEDLNLVAPCYIKASDNKVYMSDGSASDEAAKVHGFTARATKAGESVTLFGPGTRFKYGSGMTPGADLYLSATTGLLADAPSVGGHTPIAHVLNATDIMITAVANHSLITAARMGIFISSEQTGTGSAQNIAHGLDATPSKVFIAPTDLTPATVGQYVVTEGTHTSTNVVATVTTGKKFKVLALL